MQSPSGIGHTKEGRRRPQLALSGPELLCPAVAQHLLLGSASERRWVCYARTCLRDAPPDIPQHSGCDERIRADGILVGAVITALARDAPEAVA